MKNISTLPYLTTTTTTTNNKNKNININNDFIRFSKAFQNSSQEHPNTTFLTLKKIQTLSLLQLRIPLLSLPFTMSPSLPLSLKHPLFHLLCLSIPFLTFLLIYNDLPLSFLPCLDSSFPSLWHCNLPWRC